MNRPRYVSSYTLSDVSQKLSTEPRSVEMRVRMKARRQGLHLRGSRRRDPNALDFNVWRLETPRGRTVVQGDLEHIEAWLKTPRAER